MGFELTVSNVEKDPSHRYTSTNSLRHAIRQALQHILRRFYLLHRITTLIRLYGGLSWAFMATFVATILPLKMTHIYRLYGTMANGRGLNQSCLHHFILLVWSHVQRKSSSSVSHSGYLEFNEQPIFISRFGCACQIVQILSNGLRDKRPLFNGSPLRLFFTPSAFFT